MCRLFLSVDCFLPGFGEGTPQQDRGKIRRSAEIWARGRILLSVFSAPRAKNTFPHSSIFFFIILTLFPIHAIIPPARRQKEMPVALAARTARVECLAGILYSRHLHYNLSRRENQEVSDFFRELFDISFVRVIVDLCTRGCACCELAASSFSFGAASQSERMSPTCPTSAPPILRARPRSLPSDFREDPRFDSSPRIRLKRKHSSQIHP